LAFPNKILKMLFYFFRPTLPSKALYASTNKLGKMFHADAPQLSLKIWKIFSPTT
jgi:hypothetical protein